MNNPSLKISQKICQLRNFKGLTYSDVARAVGKSSNAIRDLEAGRTMDPGIILMTNLSKFFDVSLDWLVDDTQDWPPPPDDKARASDMIQKALESSGLLGEMNPLEKEVIAGLRQLPPDRQNAVLAYIQGVIDATREATRSRANAEMYPVDLESPDFKKGQSIVRNSVNRLSEDRKSHEDNAGQSRR